MPAYAIFPFIAGVVLLLACVEIFSLLRFSRCSPWTALPSAPEKPVRLVDAFDDRVYVQAADETTYCHNAQGWRTCNMSPFPPKFVSAPEWLTARFVSIPDFGEIAQLARARTMLNVQYYALLENGNVWSCLTTIGAESENVFRSSAILLLLIPFGLACWCFYSLLMIQIRRGEPTLWDFFGRGTRIK